MADWTEEEKKKIWEKAEGVDTENAKKGFKKDQCGAWILWSAYGNRNSKYGWEIDHIKPDSKGGEDVVSNARPLHWRNNVGRSNGRLRTIVTSKGNKNVWENDHSKDFEPGDDEPSAI